MVGASVPGVAFQSEPVPIQKLWWELRSSRFRNERFLCKFQEDKGFRGGGLEYAAQGNPQSDDEIAQKRRFWTRTSWLFSTAAELAGPSTVFLQVSLVRLLGPPEDRRRFDDGDDRAVK